MTDERKVSKKNPICTYCKCNSPCVTIIKGGGRVVRWCWINVQCRGVLLIWIIVEQGPTVLTVGSGEGCLDTFTLVYQFFTFSLSLGDGPILTEILSKGPLSPKQPTNQPLSKCVGLPSTRSHPAPSHHPTTPNDIETWYVTMGTQVL